MEEVQAETSTSSRLELMTASFERCLRYGLRMPTFQEFQMHFPTLPEPVVHALLELYQQVLAHIEVHSKDEFNDICNEYGLPAKLAAIEQLCAQASQGTSAQSAARIQDAEAVTQAAEASARTAAKQHEVAHLQQLLAQATSTRDHLQQVVLQRRAAAAQLATTYTSLGTDVKKVYDASKGAGAPGVENVQPPIQEVA